MGGREKAGLFRGQTVFLIAAFLWMFLACPASVYADSAPVLEIEEASEALGEMTSEYSAHLAAEYPSYLAGPSARLDPYILGRLIVKSSDPDLDPEDYGAVEGFRTETGLYYLQFDSPEKAREAEKKLVLLDTTEYVEPDAILFTEDENGKQENDVKWNISLMGFPEYAGFIKDSGLDTPKIVAVLDTGISFNHPLIRDRLMTDKAISFASNLETGEKLEPDENTVGEMYRTSHATMIAGIITQCTQGLDVKILPVRTTTSKADDIANSESCTVSALELGIDYAVKQGVDVMNISLGAAVGVRLKSVEDSIHKAVEQGIVVVVSSGNFRRKIDLSTKYITNVVLPAYIEECVVVGAVDSKKTIADFSDYGETLDVVAPGVGIWSSRIEADGNTTGTDNGTSFAAPHVAAMAAMLCMTHPDDSPEQIEKLIQDNAIDLGEKGKDLYYGYGLASFEKLLQRTVTFEPGEYGRFPKTSYNVKYGAATPAAPETTGEEGYEFTGWSPELSGTVKDNVTYTAQWKIKEGQVPGKPAAGEHVHTLVLVNAKNPTCTEDGNKVYYACEKCGAKFEDATGLVEIKDENTVIISRKGHSWTGWGQIIKPTEESEGLERRICTRCSAAEDRKIPMKEAEEAVPGSPDSTEDESEEESGKPRRSSGGGSSGGSSGRSRTSVKASYWYQDAAGWHYQENGTMVKNEWKFLTYQGAGYWYYFDENGVMKTGWLDWNGSWYYLNPVSDGWLGRLVEGPLLRPSA